MKKIAHESMSKLFQNTVDEFTSTGWIDIYFVAVNTINDMLLIVHIYFILLPKQKNLKS